MRCVLSNLIPNGNSECANAKKGTIKKGRDVLRKGNGMVKIQRVYAL